MANAAGRPVKPLVLTAEERAYMERQVRRHRVARSLSERWRIILRCADGSPSKTVAAELGVHEHTAGKWRRRFLRDGVDGLLDEDRPGRPRSIRDDQIAAIVQRRLHSTPSGATHWSIRSMAAETGFSHTTIRRIWTAFGPQPHRSETFKLSSDPLFVDKVRDIVGLYLPPPNRALALSVAEKSQIQARDREQPLLPMISGVPERRTHNYVRHGTTSLFAALDIVSGFVIGKCKQIDPRVLEGLDVHIIMDNYATHKTAKVMVRLARRPHYHVHFTPTSASWINQVERWSPNTVTTRAHTSTAQLEADLRTFIDRRNENPRPYKWTESADEVLASIKRFCQKAGQTLCGEH